MKCELDHIGIAVESLSSGKTFYETLGLGPMTTETVASEQVTVGFFNLDNDARLELLEATEAESPVAKFLRGRGPGIHHICLKVDDIHAAMASLKARGVHLLSDQPKVGAHDRLVVFIHPKSTGGVLIELSQPRGAKA